MSHSEGAVINNYRITKHFATGSYGTVYLAEKSSIIYVLKQIPLNPRAPPSETKAIKNEAKLLSLLSSKYVVKYYDSFEINNNLYIVMEYCEGGDLYTYIANIKKKNTQLNETFIWKTFIKISLGLYHIHKKKILHRDLKSLNIFLTKNNEAKIGDFGVSRVMQNTQFASTVIGTPLYLSPEICEERPYNEKSDVWALGCILYEMVALRPPFTAKSQPALYLKILKGKYDPLPQKVSDDIKTITYKLLEINYRKRPNMERLILMPIFLVKAKEYGMYDDILEYFDESKIKVILNRKVIPLKQMELSNSKNKNFNMSPNSKKNYNSVSSNMRIFSEKKNNISPSYIFPPKPFAIKQQQQPLHKERQSNKQLIYNNNIRNSNFKKRSFNSPNKNKSPFDKYNSPSKIINNNNNINKDSKEFLNVQDFMKILSQKQNDPNTLTLSSLNANGFFQQAITNNSTEIETNVNEIDLECDDDDDNNNKHDVTKDGDITRNDEDKTTSEIVIEDKDENERLKNQFKMKYEYFLNELNKYNKIVDIDKILNMYKSSENNEIDEDERMNVIDGYLDKVIPNQKSKFIEILYQLIYYDIQYDNINI
jgi:NIMA (never in mitosis gene a)-related kinase